MKPRSPLPIPPYPDVVIESEQRVWSGRFPLDVVKFRHRRFDGAMSDTRTWELWRRGHAAALLPYDPVADAVVLIEQFRFPALAAGVDPTLVERGLRGHTDTQNELASVLRNAGIEPRSCLPPEPNFDLAWQKNETVFVAEVKSITADNEEVQLRLGLGQVLRYRQRLSALGHDRVVAVLVPERQPRDPSWRELCQDLGVVLLCRNELERAPALDMP